MDMYSKGLIVSQARAASQAEKQKNLQAVRQRRKIMRQMEASPTAGQGLAGANIVNKDSIMLKRPYE